MSKLSIKNKAIELRTEGYSYSYIQSKLGVSKGTLSQWLSTIPYKPNRETIEKIGKARAQSVLVKNQQKMHSLERAHTVARADIGVLTRRDVFMLGVGLYIGEGTKTNDIVRLINSDPKIIRFAVKWFQDVCGLKISNFRLRLHLYPDNDIDGCLKFWSKQTSIPRSHFQKVQIDLRTNKKSSNRGKLPHGTAHLSIRSNGNKEFGVFLARRISGWIETVLE